MKKMIAILALVAFVSVSSAAIMFTASGDTVVNDGGVWKVDEGKTFTISIISTDAAGTFSIGAFVLSGQTAFSNNAVNAGFTISPNNGIAAAANTGNVILTAINGATATGTEDDIIAGQVLFSLNVTAGANGSIIVADDYVGSKSAIGLGSGPNFATKLNAVAATLDPITVNVVPEPMTMALLGLGGLFIRRRRA